MFVEDYLKKFLQKIIKALFFETQMAIVNTIKFKIS